jgi:hypothetical protein
MADDELPVHVFFDTQVYVRFQFQYGGRRFTALKELIEKKIVKLVLTNRRTHSSSRPARGRH